ncbi:hypothetical protein GCM10020256_60910 [Streptomyces thermocoprophilus]
MSVKTRSTVIPQEAKNACARPPEGDGGLLLLVGEDLAVSQAGVVVDGGVHIAVAGTGTRLAACLAAQDLVAAAVGDVAELLDVDMHQLAGPVAFVAAYDAAGGPVQVRQAGQAVSGQHPVHGGGHQTEQTRDPCGSPTAQHADLDDPPLGTCRGPPWGGMRAAGAVGHARLAVLPVAVGPSLGGGHGDLEAFRGPPQGPVVVDDAAGVCDRLFWLHSDTGSGSTWGVTGPG